MDDTIAAISTSLGVGAISIIRLSGPDAITIASSIFDGKDLTKQKSHTITYGNIVEDGKIIDEVLVSVMKSPKTYTKENIVEINCHGGIATTNKVLEMLIEKGARLAEPGEFTKRAFLNGRIDLMKAEGIMNLIESETDVARNLSINQLQGQTSNLIRDLRSKLVGIISQIEVNIDYPEYEDIEVMTNEKINPILEEIKTSLKDIIKKSKNGKVLETGINVAIIGRPNVGKSSLLNNLLDEEKAIVTNIAGTTRDQIEGRANINGVIFNFIDTAGIRETNDIVEKIGVEKSLNALKNCQLVILVLNNNEELTKEDLELLDKINSKNYIIIINKIDLDSVLDKTPLPKESIIEVSIKDNIGLDKLKEAMINKFNLDSLKQDDMTYLTSARSIGLLKQALTKIEETIELSKAITEIDMIEIDLKNAWEILGEIIGETYKEELLDELFSRFCLGK